MESEGDRLEKVEEGSETAASLETRGEAEKRADRGLECSETGMGADKTRERKAEGQPADHSQTGKSRVSRSQEGTCPLLPRARKSTSHRRPSSNTASFLLWR
ncbi:hypothetical protein F503_03146 [Ophiostoma piceae UAMH 11346]|uniref:Uncharacterized protein n=1 Tax=Ophiostoma piceae (strain UAMH 11346) TaxID=1262450 RepID=S3BZN6_OPHP1|nr:hypothetical protein F503_03146 [Ophiostoma piceae UAMH 11346]